MIRSRKDQWVWLVLSVCVALTLRLVPPAVWLGPIETAHMAVRALLLTLFALGVLRALRRPGTERAWLAVFIALMPIVYVRGALRVESPSLLGIELVGQVIFVAVALGGFYVTPWLFSIGLLGHGLGWDVWHRHGSLVPAWYPPVCIAVDVGLGVYAALMAPEFQRQSRALISPRTAVSLAGTSRPSMKRSTGVGVDSARRTRDDQ